MKKAKTILAILSMSFLLSPISSTCASTNDSATISQKKVSINVGETKKIKVTNYKSKIKWSCDKKSIVSIKKMNRCTVKISGKKKGTAKVLAKLANGKTLKCNVMVSEPFYTHEISTSEERSDEVTFSGKKFTNFTKKDTICNYDHIKSIPEDTTTVIRNMTELKEYLDTTTKDSSDDSFHKKAFKKYTNSFFKNHVLALVSYDASMSNNDYCFKGMTVTDNTLCINYNQTSFSYGGPLPLHSKIEYFEIAVDNITQIDFKIHTQRIDNTWDYGMAYKPVIYLYPEQEQEVTVTLGHPDALTCTYPKYQNSWNVLAKPDGTLTEISSKKQLYSLYYESENVVSFPVTGEGFIVKGEDAASFLEEKLAILGLNYREAEEFIVYWLPILEANSYNYIRFATKEEIDANMPLSVSGNPDTIIRILMTYKPLSAPISIKEQTLTPVTRSGFTVVEWGGTPIK